MLLSTNNSRAIVITEIEAMGGAERSVLALCRWLYDRGLPHHVVTYRDHIDLAQFATTPLEVRELRPEMRALRKIGALRAYFRSLRTGGLRPLMSGYQPALHATLAGLRGFHCLMHDTPSLFDSSPGSRGARGLAADSITAVGLRSGGRTIVTSDYLQAECRRALHTRAHVARMGGLTAGLRFRPRTADRTIQLLSVSRLESNKRLDWMLRALAAVSDASRSDHASDARRDWVLHIVGQGSERDALIALSTALGIANKVRFHGFVSDEQLESLYGSAHLFLMPAVQGYGIPAIEALSRGIPVLLHRDSGVSDILLNTPWATVFHGDEPNLIPALQGALRRVAGSAHLEHPAPLLPTENEWASRVASLCRWL